MCTVLACEGPFLIFNEDKYHILIKLKFAIRHCFGYIDAFASLYCFFVCLPVVILVVYPEFSKISFYFRASLIILLYLLDWAHFSFNLMNFFTGLQGTARISCKA